MKKKSPNECADSLPYDMGNIGDLLKHGMMAEFIRWWRGMHPCQNEFTFLDPFGGCVWAHPANPKALARLHTLREVPNQNFAIFDSQPDIDEGTYCGSAHVVINQIRRLSRSMPQPLKVLVSDECKCKTDALIKSDSNCIRLLACDGFHPSNGYSILDSVIGGHIRGDLVLIDPFYDPKITGYSDKIAEAAKQIAVVLFALVKRSDSHDWKRIWKSQPGEKIIVACPRLGSEKDTGVRGEKMEAHIVLSLPAYAREGAKDLCANINNYAKFLSGVVRQSISCE